MNSVAANWSALIASIVAVITTIGNAIILWRRVLAPQNAAKKAAAKAAVEKSYE